MRPLALLALLLPAAAHAASWSEFAAVFAAFPCPDGWTACTVDGAHVDPDLRPAGNGVPTPAAYRLDWFALESTPAFSPFVELPRFEVTVAAIDVAPQPVPVIEPPKVPVPPKPLVAEAPQPPDLPIAHVPDPPPELPPGPSGDCGDPRRIEAAALIGRLDADTVTCIEAAFAAAASQTDKDVHSRRLMADAWGKGDTARWETLVARHLEDVDQSDPDLSTKYAFQLSKKGPRRAEEVLHWADVALANRDHWSGPTYVDRVYRLYGLKTDAA